MECNKMLHETATSVWLNSYFNIVLKCLYESMNYDKYIKKQQQYWTKKEKR